MSILAKKILKLEKKIKDFGATYASDVLGSYNEGTQAALTIQMYKKQLDDLQRQLKENSLTSTSKYLLKGENILEIILTTGEIDTSNFIISFDSPLGKKLSTLKAGDKITIRDKEYTIDSIN